MWAIITGNIEDEEGVDMIFTVGEDYEYLEDIVTALSDLRPYLTIDLVEAEQAIGLEQWPVAEFAETWELVN